MDLLTAKMKQLHNKYHRNEEDNIDADFWHASDIELYGHRIMNYTNSLFEDYSQSRNILHVLQ